MSIKSSKKIKGFLNYLCPLRLNSCFAFKFLFGTIVNKDTRKATIKDRRQYWMSKQMNIDQT